MHALSRQPVSNQKHLHPRLHDTLHKHLRTRPLKPVAAHNATAFAALQKKLAANARPLVLDSFCGTGQSTLQLAAKYPDHLVVGVDKSEHRLAKRPQENSSNSLLLRAECEDIWQLIAQSRMTVDHHYLLYPNPWPKAKHLQRRVHGSPAFYWLLQTGGAMELRSNWQVYVEEFGVAMHMAGRPGVVKRVIPDKPLTLFEKKYHQSGHRLWAFKAGVDSRN